MAHKISEPYLRGDTYYIRFTDMDGVRRQKCCGTSNKKEAEVFRKTFSLDQVAPVHTERQFKIPTFRDELRKYQSIETNPKYQRCLQFGGSYSLGWAKKVESYTRNLEEIIQEAFPNCLNRRLDFINRRDIVAITYAIIEHKGRTKTSQIMQQVLKVVFSRAYEDGMLNYNPGAGLKTINYNRTKRSSFAIEEVRYIVQHQELFFDKQAWAFFTVLATTGMRKNEVIALSKDRLNDNILTIDSNIQGTNREINALPKWGLIRIIPLSKLTVYALSLLNTEKDKQGRERFFYKDSQWVQKVFDTLRQSLKIQRPGMDFSGLTAHILRHSLNTNLLLDYQNPMLVAEYMSWQHQEISDIQKNYTHIVARNMQCIADAIDNLYEYSGD